MKEREKLRTLVSYWIEHAREHSGEFKEWGERLKGMGEEEISQEILSAAKEMEQVGISLSKALKRLEQKEI